MARNALSLFPLFSDSLFPDRFNRIDRLFSQLTGDAPLSGAPSYDIKRTGDNRYDLILSVPGWKEHELQIETTGGQLTISGKHEEEKGGSEESWIHRGISRASFRSSFSLPDSVTVTGAALNEGLLTISLLQEIPEEEKPQRIAITNSNSKALEHQV
ncbi:Hsp20 family protein [Mangrovibacter plantisponsor]|uniref:Molecular chaperone IbpA n=1 Tax=Mangrovibacter plantisponsor TaxID=451513 RepID=A0A317PY30_9ENTR|nr:Hsp20/alpha crystallin family protein [Mangrovibacter plantisponsor]PWW06781.1 molecular chaperone IbpA [Mangrovibacter plantisponsor]